MRFTAKYSFSLSCIILILLYDTDKTLAANPPTCKFKCRPQGNSVLRLEEGVTYIYNLEGSTESFVPKAKGPFGESVKLNVKAKVEVASLSQCKTVIHLREVHVNGPDGKVHNGLGNLEQHPLVVSLQGGKLDSEVCAVHDDSIVSLNIKRAVASLLQANTGESGGSGHETDIFGSCPTHFRVSKDGDGLLVTKSKDLERCQFRENLRQPLFSIAHGHSADIQTSPLLDSHYEVEQKIKGGVLESATAKEEYLFRPFANRENGARTKVITRMVLESKQPGAPPAFPNNEPRAVFFENPHETVACSIQTLTAALHKIADHVHGPVTTTAAKEFSTLVKLMRRSSKGDLLTVYGDCKAGAGYPDRNVAKKIFTDALFQAGSADSIAAAIELLKSNEITGDEAKLWTLSFAFARHASASTLASAMTLLDNPKIPYEAYLGIGSLARHYCREHNCEGIPEFDQLLAKFCEVIGNPAEANRERENHIIAALKGLKNIKHLNEETANRVTQIMKDRHVSARIRVAALETAQSDACKGKLQKGASDIFYNREEDSELRIKGYLAMIECPNNKLANKLSEFMETEPVNQVGAFVTSHLRNLRSSSNPDKEAIRDMLYNVKPRRKFPFDVRKFSRNHEFSYNLDVLSASAAAESNVIFSQKSFLPRSANLNLTVEVFGHAFNIFELSGRAENLEKIYERYFGPRGYFHSHEPMEIVKDARNLYKEVESRVTDKYKNLVSRAKRSVSRPDINRFASKVKLYNSKLDYNIDVDLSMKILGNEISWINLKDLETPLTPAAFMDKVSHCIEEGVGTAKNFQRDLKNHFNFLDTEVAYPTSTGFPVKLSAVGSGVVYLKLGGNFDFSTFLKDPKNGLAKFEIIPSASLEIAGELGVDGYAVEAGVKLAGNLHTSTGSEITLKMLNGHGFDLHVGLPVKQSDVITVNTEVFSYVRELGLPSEDHQLEFNVPRKDYHGCFDQLQAFVGLTFCGDVVFPNDQQSIMSSAAMYPLNGHSKLSFRLEKHDESLTTYHMRFFFDIENPKNRRVEFKIDTPGTQHPREVSFLAAVLTEPEKAIDIQFISPIHKFLARAAIVDNDSEYSLSAFVRIDETQEYRARLGLVNRGSSYAPVLEYTPAGGALSDVKVDGEVIVEKQPGSPRRRFTFRGVRLTSQKLTCTVDGTIATDHNMFQSDLHVGYDQHTVGIKTFFNMVSPKNFKINAQVSPSQYPDFNVGVEYEHKRDDHMVENSLVVMHGKNLDSPQHKFSLFQQLTHRIENVQNFEISTKNTISYPLFEVQGRFDGAVTRKSLSYDVEAAYGKYRGRSKLNAKTSIKELGDYDVDFLIAAFDKELSVEAKRDVVDPHKSRFTQKLEIKPGKAYDLAAEVTHHFINNEVKLAVIATSTNYPNYALDASLLTTPALFDGYLKVKDASRDVVDGFLKFSRTAPLFGNFKFFVERHIDSHGEYKFQDNKITGVFSAHLVDTNNIIKGSADLMKAGHKYTGLIEGSSEHEGKPKWNFRIETDTDMPPKSINSKNKVSFLEKHLEVIFHGESQGKETDGTTTGGYEIVLPDGKYLVGTLKEALHVLPRNANGELFVELGYSPQRGGPLSKVFLDTYAKNIDVKKYSIDSKLDFGRECPEGNVKFSNIFRSVPDADKLIIDHESSVVGSIVKMPYHAKSHGLFSRPEINFDVSSALGDYHLNSKGKVLTGIVDNVRHFELMNEITTPLESARRFHTEHLFHFAQGDENRAHMLQFKQDFALNEKMLKLNADAELHLNHGHVKGSLILPGEPTPSNLELKYNRDINNDVRKAEVSLTANYDKDKSLAVNSIFDYRTDLDTVNGHFTGHTSLEKLKNFDVQFSHKKLSNTARNTDFNMMINNQKIEGFAKIDVTPKQPLIDITANHAAGKSRFYYKLNRKSDRQGTSEAQIVWTVNGGGQLDINSNIDIESYDNFHIIIKADSEKLGANKVKIEIGNKATKSGAAKKINFVFQNAEKKGFSGSVTYAVKESDLGFTIEGKGHIEFQAEKYPLTYKAQYRNLLRASDNETGNSFTLVADFEKGNLSFEHKITDRELFYVCKLCKEGHCGHTEIKNKLNIIDYTEVHHDASILYENTFEGRNDHFKAFSKTQRKGFSVDHESGIRLQERNYNLKYYTHDNEGGLIVHLPRREIAAVASYDLPLDLASGKPKGDLHNIHVHFDGSLYLDRGNKPAEKGNLLISGAISSNPKAVSTNGEIKVSHPALHRDLIIRGKGEAGVEHKLLDASIEIDIFNRKSQKIAAAVLVDHSRTGPNGHNITSKLEFISKGLNLDVGSSGHIFADEHGLSAGSFVYFHDSKNAKREAGALIEANKNRFFTLIKAPNRELLKIESAIQGTPDHQVIDTEVNLAELRHLTGRVETAGLHSLKASIGCKEKPDRRVEVTASVSPMLVEFRAEKLEGPAKDNLLLLVLTSNKNQETRPNFEINSEKIKSCMHEAKNEMRELAQQVKTLLVDISKESTEEYSNMIKGIKKVQPDFKPLLQHFKGEFDVIRKELEEDPQFHKFSSLFQSLFGGIIDALDAYIQRLITAYEKLSQEAMEAQTKMAESLKEVLHRFTESYEKLFEPVLGLIHQLCETGCALAGYGLDFIKAHEPEIRHLLIGVSGYIQEFAQICTNTFEQLRREAEDFFNVIKDQLRSMPIISEFEQKYKELTNVELPQTLKNFYSEFTFALEDILKNSELRDFYENVFSYLIRVPLPSFLVKLPKIGMVRELSFIRYLKSLSELPTLTEYYFTYRPFFHPMDNIPPFKAYGMIVGSHHFFTFDQKHFAFKGICSYVLAQDFLDGNFSIVANLENGKIKSITVSDHKDVVEMFNDNTVAVNGNHGDYPVNHNDFEAWIRYGTFNLKHKAGVFITKYLKQDLFIFRINGFYFGRTRGLLGTISNEHFDDYTLPNGHIAKDATEFANAYKVLDACPASTEYPPTQDHAPECTQIFSSESDLRGGYNLINPQIYREACDQHAGSAPSDKLNAACDVASAYVLALKQGYMPFASLPEECVQCTINGQHMPFGQSTNIQSPQGKADVVIVFEQSEFNAGIFKELITPLIASLSHDLKERGLGDVEFALIGYNGPDNAWPQHYGNNGKITYEGKADKIKFKVNEQSKTPSDTWEKRLDAIIKYINTELGREPIVRAMEEANIYPFRQGSSKIILLVSSQKCPLSPTFPFSLQIPRIFAVKKHYDDLGLQFHFITPMGKTMKLSSKPDHELKNVVGFDAQKLYTFADAKKSDVEGDPTDRPHLVYDNDLCLSFSQRIGGAAFNSDVFAHAKPEQQKKFVHVVSKRIAKGAVEHRFTETCSCKLYHGIFSYPKCKVTEVI